MKFCVVSVAAIAALASGHCIFQKVSVNGKEYASLAGLRAPNQNNPTEDVNSQDIICGKVATSSQEVITVAPGDKVGAWWQHVIGGAQFPGDPDNPIAKSHKGPITAWLAKVPSAASTGITGLSWFKVAEDNLDTGSSQWAVDRMINNNGWSYFNLPQCIAPGEYLLRVELLALHSAYASRGAQFYISSRTTRQLCLTFTELLARPTMGGSRTSLRDPGLSRVSPRQTKMVAASAVRPFVDSPRCLS